MTYQREFTEKLNMAIVGVGNHCYRNLLPALHYLPVTLKAVCDTNEQLAKTTSAEYGCQYYTDTRTMYENENLDAVLLCVSARLHPQLAVEAFEAGLHVWMEKPVAMRAYEVEQMIARRRDKVAVVGFKKAFMPSVDKALEIVNSEQYGGLQTILAVYPMSLPENGQQVLEDGTFTNWLANGCHPLSLMLAVAGQATAVTAHSGNRGGGLCMIEFANGVLGNFHFATGPQPNESYSFFGEKWHLHIDNSHRVSLQRGIPFQYNRTHNYIPAGDDSGAIVWEWQNCLSTLENKSLFTQGIYSELKYFCDCILQGRPAQRGSLEFALDIMKVYEAALLSSGTRIII